MKIWIVKHHQDNGESYEDRYTWDDFMYFSTYEKAYAYYCESILPDGYYGNYTLTEKTLDTQEEVELEKSPWGKYTQPEWPEDDSDYQDLDDSECDPYMGSYWDENLERWRYGLTQAEWFDYPESDANPPLSYDEKEEEEQSSMFYDWLVLREKPIIKEWLTHKGENKAIFDEIAKDKIDKLCANLVIEANTRNGGFCCNFSYGGADYYASLADLACVGTECMIFYEGDWTDLYCIRHISLTEDSLKECVKEFLLSTL